MLVFGGWWGLYRVGLGKDSGHCECGLKRDVGLQHPLLLPLCDCECVCVWGGLFASPCASLGSPTSLQSPEQWGQTNLKAPEP